MFGEDIVYHYGPLVVSGIALIIALTPNLGVPHAYRVQSQEWLNGQEWTVSKCRWCERVRRERVNA